MRGERFALFFGDLGVDRFDLQQVGNAQQIAAGERRPESELLGDGAKLRHDRVGDLRVDAHVVVRLRRALHADGDVDLAARERLRGDGRAPSASASHKILGDAHRGFEEAVIDALGGHRDEVARRKRAGGAAEAGHGCDHSFTNRSASSASSFIVLFQPTPPLFHVAVARHEDRLAVEEDRARERQRDDHPVPRAQQLFF